MDIDHALPRSEAALLAVLLKLPYRKRNGYALRLVNTYRNDHALLSLIQELLSTTLLADRVPFPDKELGNGYITLLFPQTTASKRFWQRELGLTMASALGQPGIPFLLDAIIHPSTAGKSRAIKACVSQTSGVTDEQLVEIYQKSVPATQESLHNAMAVAGRIEALKTLQLWKEPPPGKKIEPRCVVLERDLRCAKLRDRDAIWTRAGLLSIRPHRRLHDPEYVQRDSGADLVTTLFDLLELYPPPHLIHQFQLPRDVPSIPSSLGGRIYSFLRCDLPRTLRLIRSTCYVPDPKHKGRDLLKFPPSFMHQQSSSRFWHMLSLEQQTEHLLPFILELMLMHDQILLKNGQLLSADLLRHARWQIIVGVAESALASLDAIQTVQSTAHSERNGIVAFVVHAIEILASRLSIIAYREDRTESQTVIEHGLRQLLCRAVKQVLATFKVSAPSHKAFVKSLMQHFILPLLGGSLKQYPPLVELLFDSTKDVFDDAQVSNYELVPSATQFFLALKRKRRTVFDIPNGGVVQPYCGIRETDNDTVFHLLLQLKPPRDNPSFYVQLVLHALSKQQREAIWTYFDPEYVCTQLLDEGGMKSLDVFIQVVEELPGSPHARLHMVKSLLDHPKMNDAIAAKFYPLLDISDTPSRELLQKNTYKRLFADRYLAYQHLMTATWAQESPKEYINTMRFLIPRIKNEIQPDAQRIPGILHKNSVGDILRLLDHATNDEAKQLAQLYLDWEKQNNEAITRVIPISDYILDLGKSALTHFAGSPAHPFFHLGMDLLWVREVLEKGFLKAHETYNVQFDINSQSQLTEGEELQRRQFILASKDALGETGYWRISDELQFVDTLLEQYHKIHQTVPFECSVAYPIFISSMLKLLGTRWTTIPSLRDYTERQLDVLRNIVGSKEQPADWKGKAQREAIQHILLLRGLYDDSKVFSETLPWWSEFRHLRLFSTDASVEVELLHNETFDSEGNQDQEQFDTLVEKLLNIDDSAIYLGFVRDHLMENRQDILKDSHVTGAPVGLFNQLPKDAIPQPPPWDFTFSRRFYPHQCQRFAARLMETIHSGEVSLHQQVNAAEQLTRLPTTTIIELAELLAEDLNPRIVEAILMFLPHLDEPASGIQFLLAPTYLDGDLARTAVFSIRNALQHVATDSLPKMLVPVFPPADSKRLLKVTVMKELVRLVCEHISHEEHQTLLMTLWKRKLHQDVRIALLQSVISFLGGKQENLAWCILRDAVSNPSLLLDDALFALLAVHTSNPLLHESDVHAAHISIPDILVDMARNSIPDQCHDIYTEDVLFPLAQLSLVVPNVSEKEAKGVRDRLRLLQQSAYHTIFFHFLAASNAQVFARRGLDAAKSVALSDVQGDDLFLYFVYGIGKCVALDAQCWEVLCQLVDFLARAVGSPAREPTRTSLKAIQRLHSMNLGSNMTFQLPESTASQLTVDRMSLLEPLAGCDHFAVIFWERRFYLFSCKRNRISPETQKGVVSSELNEARSLLLELTRLSGELQYDLTQLKSKTTLILDTASAPVADTLVKDLLAGRHGFGDVVWINELRLQVLSQRLRKSLDYAQSLAAFQTRVSNYHQSFYAQHWQILKTLVETVLTSDSRPKSVQKELMATLLDPIFDRVESSALDSHILHLLLEALPDVILRHRPQWALESINAVLSSLHPWKVDQDAVRRVLLLVEFVNTTSIQGNTTVYKTVQFSDFCNSAALLVETIYSGALRNFDLARVVNTSVLKTEPLLMYPYFVNSQDNGRGGDMENRQSNATVAQLLDRYQEWNTPHASQFISGTRQPQITPSVLVILKKILDRFPQLALVHPSLFFSYAVLTFGQSDLDTKTKTDSVLSHIQSALMPKRQGESGLRWGWAPPLSLTLSFAQVLFTEIAKRVADAVLGDRNDATGLLTCKLAALQLLEWWAGMFYDRSTSNRDLGQLVKSMEREEGREHVMRQYDELRVLACRDESRVIRERAFALRAGVSLSF